MVLVAMLVILALMTTVVVASTRSHQMLGSLMKNMRDHQWALQELQRLESLAIVRLQDYGAQQDKVSLTPHGYPIEPRAASGTTFVHGELEDLQGRVNLNNLLSAPKTSPGDEVVWSASGENPGGRRVTMARLAALFEETRVDPALIDRILDWSDPDSRQRYPGGAEDDYYLRLRPPYRAANQPLAALDELLLLKGMSDEWYERLLPLLVVLPEATGVNVNTAPVPVLRALHPSITDTLAERIVQQRGEKPFPSVEAFLGQPFLSALEMKPDDLVVTSRFFALHSRIRVGEREFRFESCFLLAADRVRQVARRYGG